MVIDKTAQYVAKSGKHFEERILSSEEGKTAKFHFLKEYHPFHAYYAARIRAFEEGKGDEEDKMDEEDAGGDGELEQAEAEPQEVASSSTMAQPTLITPLARLAREKVEVNPPKMEFLLPQKLTVSLAAEDNEIIKLTAQYVAANGKSFLSSLVDREMQNPRFDFLNPSHTLFSYFTKLVDMYTRILEGAPDLRVNVDNRTDPEYVLKMAVQRWKWKCEKERQEVEEKEGELSSLLIDWKDFTVVETITFEQDELRETTTSIGAVAAAKEAQLTSPQEEGGVRADTSQEMEVQGEQLHVVTDYQPRLAEMEAQRTMVDPISGQTVPVEQMSDHIKAQLMDPHHRVEHQRFVEKQKVTGVAAGDAMVSSLMQFAQKRPDILTVSSHEGAAPSSSTEPTVAMPPAPKPVVMRPPVMPGNRGYSTHNNAGHYGMSVPPPGPPPRPPPPQGVPPGTGPRGVTNAPAWMAEGTGAGAAFPVGGAGAAFPVGGAGAGTEPAAKRSRTEEAQVPVPVPVAPVPVPVSASVPVSVPATEGGDKDGPGLSQGSISLVVHCAEDATVAAHNLQGQVLTVAEVQLGSTIKALKQQISSMMGMAPNKMNLQRACDTGRAFIKDALTVAEAQLVEGDALKLTARVRGGK